MHRYILGCEQRWREAWKVIFVVFGNFNQAVAGSIVSCRAIDFSRDFSAHYGLYSVHRTSLLIKYSQSYLVIVIRYACVRINQDVVAVFYLHCCSIKFLICKGTFFPTLVGWLIEPVVFMAGGYSAKGVLQVVLLRRTIRCEYSVHLMTSKICRDLLLVIRPI